jgi:hypothetical protein
MLREPRMRFVLSNPDLGETIDIAVVRRNIGHPSGNAAR